MKFHWHRIVTHPVQLAEFIVSECGISKSQAKKALIFGGGWLTAKGERKAKRVRRASLRLTEGDNVAFYYDAALLSAPVAAPELIMATPNWGIWSKPAGIPTQGTTWGDRNSLEVQIKAITGGPAHCVHRLDREASGLVLVAYGPKFAAKLSTLWPAGAIRKFYRVEVEGAPNPREGVIAAPLDGKEALTHYRCSETHALERTELDVEIKTGRLHQIRRHLAGIGHPVLGDARYGAKPGPLALSAVRLVFSCPLSGQPIDCRLPRDTL